ncbi:MAG: SDR family NAD(P)-dependent oxidoreductase [Chromatiales bacterium]|jgi:short-subunit dehydrogenase
MSSLNPKISDWRGRRVWIVGASSGIGAALARQLDKAGARLALSARREDALREIIGRHDGLLLPFDVTDRQALQAARDRLLNQWNGIDMLVYSAGHYTPMRAWEIDQGVVSQTLAVNLQGAYNLIETVTPRLLEQGTGGICLIASVAGYTGLPKALAYGPSKAALINLAQILYTDLSPRGIGVYLVNPGFVDTRLTRRNDFRMPALISPERAAREIVAGIGKGRFEIHFPKRFTRWMKWLARMPDPLRFYLVKRSGA